MNTNRSLFNQSSSTSNQPLVGACKVDATINFSYEKGVLRPLDLLWVNLLTDCRSVKISTVGAQQMLGLMGSCVHFFHALLPYLSCSVKNVAQVGTIFPLASTTDWLKLKPFKLNAIVNTHRG